MGPRLIRLPNATTLLLSLCEVARGGLNPLEIAPFQDRALRRDCGRLFPAREVRGLRLLHGMLLFTENGLHVRLVMVVVELSKQVLVDL